MIKRMFLWEEAHESPQFYRSVFAAAAFANEDIPDQYPNQLLYSALAKCIPSLFGAIVATYENADHNDNLSSINKG